MRGILTLAAVTALGALGSPAFAAGSIWDHNGSKMTLEENGTKRKLVYSELRQGLDKAGIKVGTVLFNGERKANGRFAGFARIYKANCNPVDYFVEGTLNEGKGEIVLQGQAPVYASGTSCEVTGYSDSSPAATLSFAKVGDAPNAVVAERTPPVDPIEQNGRQIEQGDRGPDNNEYLPPAQRDRVGNEGAPPQQQPPQQVTPRNPPPQQQAAPRDTQPSQPDAFAPRDQNRTPPPTQNRRAEANDEEIDETQPPRFDRYREREYDRRYSRAPNNYDDRPYRRRPGIWEPEDEMEESEPDGFYDEPPAPAPSPFWGRRGNW